MAKKVNSILDKIHTPNWLTFFLAILIILRIPSFFEPFSYGDEMIYLTLGEAIRRGLVLYRDVHDNKPPFLYFLAAVAGNVFWFRAILAGWMLVTTILFWKLTQTLFPKRQRLQQVATVAFGILTTLPLLEGHVANAELFMLGPTIGALLVLLNWKKTPRNLLFAGFLFSLSTLFKVPSLFDVPVIFVFWFIASQIKNKPAEIIRRVVFVGIGFALPILATFAWYAYRGAFNEYLVAAFLQNVGYLSSWRPDVVQQSFLTKNGPLLLRGLVVLVGAFFLWIYRKKLSKTFIFATLWLLFSLFAVTLSERPYPHYLIQSAPSISLLIAILIASPRYEQVLALFPLSLAVFIPVYFNFYYYNTASYYQRFIEFAGGQINQRQYFEKFDGNVWRNYKLAEFLQASSKQDDSVFVWGDSPPIYALSRRLPPYKYVAQYHIFDFSNEQELLSSLESKPPVFVIVLPNNGFSSGLAQFLDSSYVEVADIEGAKVWRRLTDAVIEFIKR